jgi:hypothetical protein
VRVAHEKSNSNARCAPHLLVILISISFVEPWPSLERFAMARLQMEGVMGVGEEEILLVAVEVTPLAMVHSVDLVVALQTLQLCLTLIRILGI